jgi:hypothetical protein
MNEEKENAQKEKIAPNHIHATEEPGTIAMKDQQNPYKKARTMKRTKWKPEN